MESGYIKIDRKILKWEWYDDINTKTLFIHLLVMANWQDRNWHGIEIKRGQRVTSIANLAKETSLTPQKIRTCLTRLQRTGEIIVKSTNKFTIITIINYNTYQNTEVEANKQLTNKQQTNNKQITTNEEYKNKKKEKNKDNTFVPTDVETSLCCYLKDRILSNNPKARVNGVVRWAKDVRLMVRIDKRTPEEIRALIDFSQSDSFWKANILSMGKLREKFDQLTLKMKGGNLDKGKDLDGYFERITQGRVKK